MKKQKKKIFKREYIPVIFAILILVLLIAALVFVILYKNPTKEEKLPMPGYQQEEVTVDNKNSKCSKNELKSLSEIAQSIEFESEKVEIKIGTSFDIDVPGAPEVDSFGTVYNLTLKNMTDDLYVVITNDFDETETILNKETIKENKYVYQTKFTEKIITYTLELRSNKYDCINEVIRKFTFITPIYNAYSDLLICNEVPEYKFCQEFITEDIPTYQEFFNELEKYKKENNIPNNIPTITKKGDTTTTTKIDKE